MLYGTPIAADVQDKQDTRALTHGCARACTVHCTSRSLIYFIEL